MKDNYSKVSSPECSGSAQQGQATELEGTEVGSGKSSWEKRHLKGELTQGKVCVCVRACACMSTRVHMLVSMFKQFR